MLANQTKNKLINVALRIYTVSHKKYSRKSIDLSSIIKPVTIKANKNPDDINIGAELSSNLHKNEILRLLNTFYKMPEIKQLSEENGLDQRLFSQAFLSFRRYCLESDAMPVEFHIIMSDIMANAGHISDIFPHFLSHAKKMFPHIECMDDLKKISDLRDPLNWYPEARAHTRKIIFHAGPTNSGKTYQALERFTNAKSGIYCGPLKLLANEVFIKTNSNGTPCDLVTGEERKYALANSELANHVSCTVEMARLMPAIASSHYEVAVIDEIQMIKDPVRGWAWTRALLGMVADEIHLCGEPAAIQIVKDILAPVGEQFESRFYKRLTPLKTQERPLGNLDNVQDGDCIVCFSKNDIYTISQKIEAKGTPCAVIYGGLPPGTKLEQAKRFNDPQDPCKIMVATDAIGMGLNLSIKRVIFYSLLKPNLNENGDREMERLSVSQALQIAGRAGRYGTQYSVGEVTTFKQEDLYTLKDLLSGQVEPIEAAGLHPTAEQIELFAYHLPKATLSNLLDIFTTVCRVDNTNYFMCNMDDFKFLADVAQHIPLPLKARYTFCCAPISKKQPFVCTMFIKFARQFSRGQPLTFDWLCQQIGWPFTPPLTIVDLVHLEGAFDVLDTYLWLSYRFVDMFPDVEMVRDMQKELDTIIKIGVTNLTKLLCNTYNTDQQSLQDDEIKPIRKPSSMPKSQHQDSNINPNTKSYQESSNSRKNQQNVDAEVVPNVKRVFGKNRLTEQLLAQGILTPKMMRELQKEWTTTAAAAAINTDQAYAKRHRPGMSYKIYQNQSSYSRQMEKKSTADVRIPDLNSLFIKNKSSPSDPDSCDNNS